MKLIILIKSIKKAILLILKNPSLILKAIFGFKKDGIKITFRKLRSFLSFQQTEINYQQTKSGFENIYFSNECLISIILPTYNSNLRWLSKSILSVINQYYKNWELCIVDDASKNYKVRDLIEKFSSEDNRIKYIFRENNGHISEASNSALSIATGDWVALLDHDDLLHPEALYWVAKVISRYPNSQLIYSDEDKVNERGNRSSPYFKTDFNRQLFYSHNMICHLGVYRKSILDKIGGFRKGFEGAQDYDLALRCLENIDVSQIHHIPKVLYHWRMHGKSTAKSADAKPYAMIAGQKALNEHFQRIGVSATAELIGHGYRTHYQLPSILPKVSLIIPTRNGLKFLKKCIESILEKTTYQNYEILIIDNGSDEVETLEYFKKICLIEKIRIIRDDRDFNYSALNNLGVNHSTGDIIGLINNDIEVISPDWLSEIVSIAIQRDVGAVGAKLLYTDGKIQHAGIILGIGGWAGHSHKGFPRETLGYVGRVDLMSEFSAVTGACLLIRKELYLSLGGLDEVNLKIACNDVDLCLKANAAGYRNIYTPYAELFHHESATRGYEDNPEKQERFKSEVEYMTKKWGTKLSNDPMYSPNLTLDREDFSYAFPPRLHEYENNISFNSRVQKALNYVDKNSLGLEIGPSHNPLAMKKDGYKVHILDHASKQQLIAKYMQHNVNTDNIEEVDFVWSGEPLTELIGKESCYEWILASHVIEHTPDLISFLSDCEKLLKNGGILSLIIPDKRYCFDYFNPLTTTGEILDAHYQGRKKPTLGKIFDHFANASLIDGNIAWNKNSNGEISLCHSFDTVKDLILNPNEEYVDVHCWKFVPESFRLILSDLQSLNLMNLNIEKEFDTDGCEFYVTLIKGKEEKINLDRLAKLKKIQIQLASLS